MFSHASDVPEGESTFLKQMSREECTEIARYGGFRYGQAIVAGARVNQTIRASATVVGALDNSGACQGALFVWRGHEYPEAVVTVDLEVTIREFSASLDMDEREIKLPAGVTCPYANGLCADEEIGYAFWEIANAHECDFERYETLFHGDGVKVSDNTTDAPDIYIANSTGNVQFGLAAVCVDQVCGHRLIRTENARLFIVEAPKGHGIKAKTQLDVQNILLADYFNTKLTYYVRHVKTEFTSM